MGRMGEDDTWTMERAGYSFQLHSSSHTLGEITMMLVMMIITLNMMVMKMIIDLDDEDDHVDVKADGRPDLLHHKPIVKVCQVEVDHGHHGHLDTHHFHHDLHVVEHLTSLKIRKSKERKYIQVKFT